MAILGKSKEKEEQTNSYSGQPDKNGVRAAKKITRINDDFAYLQEEELSAYPTSDEVYIKDQGSRLLQSQNTLAANKENRRKSREESEQNSVDYRQVPQSRTLTPNVRNRPHLSVKKKVGVGTKALARTRASIVNSTILAWNIFIWPMQLVFAILSVAGLGAASFFSYSADENSGWLGEVVEKVVSTVVTVVKTVAEVAGFDFSIVGGLFVIPWMLVMVIGLITLMTASVQYILASLHPFSGEGAGFKIGTFLIAIIGYMVPLANMFPWIFLFMLAVWKYPR